MLRGCRCDPATWDRRNYHGLVTWTVLVRCYPTDSLVQELRHGTIRVMIEACHLSRIQLSIRKHAIPTLPNRSGTHLNLVQPRRDLCLEEDSIKVLRRIDGS